MATGQWKNLDLRKPLSFNDIAPQYEFKSWNEFNEASSKNPINVSISRYILEYARIYVSTFQNISLSGLRRLGTQYKTNAIRISNSSFQKHT